MSKPGDILKEVFGFDEFLPLQEDIIEKLLQKRDCLVIMPTGGGKSLCYQIPALIFQGLTLVISPLISLMRDQVEQLIQMGVPAAVLNSSLSLDQYRRNVLKVKQGTIKLLYMAPETLLRPKIQDMLSSLTIDCLAVDEAHCISEWGHDFRPEYRQLSDARKAFSAAVCVALTATATPRVREDIKACLGLESSREFVASFDRANLLLRVLFKDDPLDQTLRLLEGFSGESGIIYCFSRRQVDELCKALESRGLSVRPYHAGMSDVDRNRNQDLFIRDQVRIMVATVAFGMGIDKPDVRFVIHYDMPKNIEGYYQEIGRAGRDGLPAQCVLLFSYGDIRKIRHLIDGKDPHEQRVATIQLNALVGLLETEACRRIPLLRYFGEDYPDGNCGMCDNCLTERKDLVDITVAAQKFLSCVKRTGERFGAGHIIDVLRGSRAKKVLGFGHDRLSTYGIGREFSKRQWFHLSRQFIQKGLLSQDMEFGGLGLTPGAWPVLRGEEKVEGLLQEEKVEERREQGTRPDYDRGLFGILRDKRKELAEQAGLPPYVIFSDRSLMEMATFFPVTEEAFLDIHGVGEVKRERYASVFLPLIREYRDVHGIVEERTSEGSEREEPAVSPASPTKRYEVIGEAFNSGGTVDSIIERFGIRRSTVLDHLFRYFQAGNPIAESEDILSLSSVSPERRRTVFDRFEELGIERLKPVFEALGGEVDYEELRILRLYYIGKNGLTGGGKPGAAGHGPGFR